MFGKKYVAWITHKLSVIFTFVLVYWTLVFISVTVFDFKIFRENMTQAFNLSILGILAILCGSTLLNVMTNISIIAENIDKNPEVRIPKKKLLNGTFAIAASFLLLFAALYLGDLRNSAKKERYLVASAERLYNDNKEKFAVMDKYVFDRDFIFDLSDSLFLITRQDKNFQNVGVIVQDSIGKDLVFLSFAPGFSAENMKNIKKEDFLLPTNMEEREYLNRVFSGVSKERRYSSSDGSYELYFPVTDTRTKFILYLSEYQSYGKYGS
jgi:hypothetical protein